MGDNYFDVDAALKEGVPESEIAAHLAELHKVDRDAYLKDGETDADFLNEFKTRPLPGAPAAQDDMSNVSNAANVMGATVAAAIPGAAQYGINKLMGTVNSVMGNKGYTTAAPQPEAASQKTFAAPSEVSARVTAANQPPRPAGPTDVVNWASGKDERTGQYGRGYLGGTSMPHEAELHKQADALEAKNPGYKIKPGTTSLLIPESEYNRVVNETKTAETGAKDAMGNKARMAAELRAQRLAKVNPANLPTATKAANVASTLGNAPVAKRALTGYNVADLLQAQNPFEAAVSTVGAAAPYGSGLAEKLVPRKYKPLAKLLGPAIGAAAPAVNWLERKIIGSPEQPAPEQHAAGGLIQGFKDGRLALAEAAAKKAAGFLFQPRETQIVKASEALAPHIGKKLGLTQTDNFGVHGGRWGGNQFPNFQNTNPLHQEHNVVWMNDSPKHAQDMIKRGGDNTIWSTYIGGPDQLKSNKTVFNDILQNHYARDLSPEQIDLINNRIATYRPSPKKPLVFPQAFDIRDKFATQELGADTFGRRGALADILGTGQGVGGTKSGIALPQYQDILRSHRDPLTEGVPTSSVGSRLFSVDKDVPTQHTDLFHPDYRDTVHGADQGVQFERPVPQNLIVPNWYNEINARAPGKTHGNAWFSYMKNPQNITEDLLTNMQKEGYAEGGQIQGYAGGGKLGALAALAKKFMPAAAPAARDANLAKYLEKSAVQTPMYHGTSHDISEFKPGQANAIFVSHSPKFAHGFAGVSENNAAHAAMKAMDDTQVADLARRAKAEALKNDTFANDERWELLKDTLPSRGNIMQVHVNAQNPFDFANPEHFRALTEYAKSNPELGKKINADLGYVGKGSWESLETPHVQQAIKDMGHDSFYAMESGQKNLGLYDPRQVKSATGNIGTYDPLNPDVARKKGGLA